MCRSMCVACDGHAIAGGPTSLGYHCWLIASCIHISLALEVRALPSLFADQTTSRIIANWECEKLRFRTGSTLVYSVEGVR